MTPLSSSSVSLRSAGALIFAFILALALLLPLAANAQLSLPKYDLWTWTEDGQPRLGNTVAAGDFDGDGFDDMAIASPSADVAGFQNSGRLHLRRTHADGSATWASLNWCLDPSDSGDQYRLGDALVFGDFDGDGDEDLAIGIPGATSGGVDGSGAVCIVYARSAATSRSIMAR